MLPKIALLGRPNVGKSTLFNRLIRSNRAITHDRPGVTRDRMEGVVRSRSGRSFTLIDTVPAAIADPGTTAVWEQALDMIEAGQLTLDTFIAKQSAWITQLIAQYRGTSLSIKIPEGPACPQCGERYCGDGAQLCTECAAHSPDIESITKELPDGT